MSEPIRVLQVVTKMDRAGLETMLMNYYRVIDRSKVQFDFLVHRSESGQYDEEILSLGGRIFQVSPIHPRFFVDYFRQLNDFFKKHPEYRIVHSHIDALSAFPLYAAKKAGVSVRIAHSHTSHFDRSFKYPIRLICKQLIRFYATDLYACSTLAAQFMFGQKAVKMGKVEICTNAIDLKQFCFSPSVREVVRAELELTSDLLVGHVGRFSYAKNHDFLVDIFAEMYQKNANAVLVLIGCGDFEKSIHEKVNKLGINHAVRFLGNRNDVFRLLQAMDVFVFPSRYEGLGIVLIEAQATGLPCFTSADVVPRDVQATSLLEFVPLSMPFSYWADRVLSCSHEYSRKGRQEEIRKHGYDISQQAESLQDFYVAKGS